MALTKSSCPRQIEEENGAGVSNFPKGPDHEDDTTNQGSGDIGATNLPILGLDGDGDNEISSPSSYLNLDQHENKEDERNVEHEGDVNEEDEGNDKQVIVGTLSESQVRHGRGPKKLPSGHFVITMVNEVGDPMQPLILVNAWKISVGKLIRENVPVTYRFWKGKTHEEKYIVLDSIKQNLWDTLMAKFKLPRDYNTCLVRSRTLRNGRKLISANSISLHRILAVQEQLL
jgi:hypothetical protein